MRLHALAALATFALLAGCAAESPTDTAATTEPAKQYDEGVANRLDVPVLSRDAVPAGARNLTSVPEWRLGEYWVYDIVDGFTGRELTATRVVAGTDGPNYLVGFPIDAFSNDVLIFHLPGVGDVARADLSFEVHDALFTPLKFPLEAGDSWTTQFEGRDGLMEVVSVEGRQAHLQGSGSGWNISMTYDADAGEVVELTYPGYMTLKVTQHGFAYDGIVRVPHSHDLVFMNGRVAGALGTSLEPRGDAPMKETVDIEPGYDRLAFTIIVGNALLGNAPVTGTPVPAGGYYDEKVTAPNGTVYEVSAIPSDPTLKVVFFGASEPAGTWTLEHTAGGPGLAFVEGIGYHSIDVQLPSGCVVKSFNAAHHAAPCKVDAADAGVTKDTSAV